MSSGGLSENFEVWLVGLSDQIKTFIQGSLEGRAKITELDYNIEKLMETTEPVPTVILCGPPPQDIQASEVAQMLRMQFQTQPIFYLTFQREAYDRKIFIKNGFTDSFIFPLDLSTFQTTLTEHFASLSKGKIQSFRPVKIIDLGAGETLNFDTSVYLPVNKKYVKLSTSGDELDSSRLEKLQKHNMNSLYVATDQMQKFYEYTAEKLAKIGSSQTLSETEKKEKLGTAVRGLMSNLFNDSSKEASFEQGQALVNDCKQIINNFIFTTDKGDWYKQILQTMGEQGHNYSHYANVSTYASLFSIGLGIGDPVELATAGLLHDLGLSDVPYEILTKPESERTPEEKKIYENHPELTIKILKSRKFIMSDKLIKIILQHHERFNGTGYPKQLYGDRITKEAQVLALADEFDYLTAAREGKPLMSPLQAVEYFRNLTLQNPTEMKFNPDLIKLLLKLFPSAS